MRDQTQDVAQAGEEAAVPGGDADEFRQLPYGDLSRFVDVAFGFDTRGYKPTPLVNGVPMELPPSDHHQNMFLGVSFNAYFEGGDPAFHGSGMAFGLVDSSIFTSPSA